MKIQNLHIYPIKSTLALDLNGVVVNEIGFEYDRYFAIANSKNEILTARKEPKLLKIKTELIDNVLRASFENDFLNIPLNTESSEAKLSLFNKEVSVKIVDSKFDKWFSRVLGFDCNLVKINPKKLRSTGVTKVSFNDVYPIHLISVESVNALNNKLESKIEINRFRPNIIVSETKPFEEEKWDNVTIGKCEFKVVSKTQRCSLITIDPITGEKNKIQEPLRTLAKEFGIKGKADFGIYLIPTKTGPISKSDKLSVTI